MGLAFWACLVYAAAGIRYHFRLLKVRSVTAAILGVSFGLHVASDLPWFGEARFAHDFLDIGSGLLFSISMMWDVLVVVRKDYKADLATHHLDFSRLMLFR